MGIIVQRASDHDRPLINGLVKNGYFPAHTPTYNKKIKSGRCKMAISFSADPSFQPIQDVSTKWLHSQLTVVITIVLLS